MDVLWPVIVLGGLGLVFGGLLGIAAKAFHVDKDERAEQVAELLPGANCGGCGYAGCNALADALIEGKAVPSVCAALKTEQLKEIAGLLGVEASAEDRRVAKVLCSGTCDMAATKCKYEGIHDCVAAQRYGGGEIACQFGCCGYGSCVSACKFGAISIIDGVARVNEENCVGCGTCAAACPKNIIVLVPATQRTFVLCRSKEKAAAMKDICKAGCIGCGICAKNCPAEAITMAENLASIDYEKCTNCGVCAEKCPKNVIEYKEEI